MHKLHTSLLLKFIRKVSFLAAASLQSSHPIIDTNAPPKPLENASIRPPIARLFETTNADNFSSRTNPKLAHFPPGGVYAVRKYVLDRSIMITTDDCRCYANAVWTSLGHHTPLERIMFDMKSWTSTDQLRTQPKNRCEGRNGTQNQCISG